MGYKWVYITQTCFRDIKVAYKGVYITQTCFRDIKVAYTLHRHVFVMSVKEGRKYNSFFFIVSGSGYPKLIWKCVFVSYVIDPFSPFCKSHTQSTLLYLFFFLNIFH